MCEPDRLREKDRKRSLGVFLTEAVRGRQPGEQMLTRSGDRAANRSPTHPVPGGTPGCSQTIRAERPAGTMTRRSSEKKKKKTHATWATFIATGRIFSPRSSYDIVMPDTQSRHQKTRRKFEKNLKITVSSDKRPSTMTQRRVTYITVNKLLGIDKCI